MKKTLISFTLATIVALAAGRSGAVPGETTTLMGRAVEIATFAMIGTGSEEADDAARFRAENGFPVGILTDDGEVYLAVYRNPAPASGLETGNRVLVDLIGKNVVARGRAFRATGVNVFEISVVSEM